MSSRAWTVAVLVAAVCLSQAGGVRAEVYLWVDEQGVSHFSDVPRHAGYKRHRVPGRRATGRPSPRQFDGIIVMAGKSHGVAPALVKAVVHAESNFDRRAVSRKGAQGLMQLMPGTARSLGVDDPFDAWQNIYGGTRYLGALIDRYDGNLKLALAAYNAGAQAVKRHGGIPPYRETQGYVRRVLNLYRRYDADFR